MMLIDLYYGGILYIMIPRILLGTSPFFAAGQFGHRSYLYHEMFYQKPANILTIIRKAYRRGVNGIQLIPFDHVVEAVQNALDEGLNLTIVGSIRLRRLEKDLKTLEKLNASALILHGEVTDTYSVQKLSAILNKISNTGKSVGIATHKPKETLTCLRNSSLDYDIIMLPLNALGIFMDGKPDEIIEILEEKNKHVIAMKTLAAGMIPFEEALKYVSKVSCVRSVALGVASEQEVEETVTLAKQLLKG